MVFSTSITKGIDVKSFNKDYENGQVEIVKFPGKKDSAHKALRQSPLGSRQARRRDIACGG